MKLEKTITSIFIVPTLKIGKYNIKERGFINGFLYNELLDVKYESDKFVYVLFKPKNLESFQEFLNEQYAKATNIVEDVDYDGGFVVVIYKLREDLKEDFELIKKGRYSKTSEKFKNMFPKKVVIDKNGLKKEEYSLQYRIFNKSQELLDYWEDVLGTTLGDDSELWEGFCKDRETLSIKNIEVYVEQQ